MGYRTLSLLIGLLILSSFAYADITVNENSGNLNIDSPLYVSSTGDNYFAGNVGIGTTTPKSKLDVEGGLAVGSSYSGNNAAPTNGAIIEGNVGIGTPNPQSNLEIYSASDNVHLLRLFAISGTQNDNIMTIVGGSTSSDYNLLNVTNDGYNDNEVFVVRGDGNVGIGNGAPDARLHVTGGVCIDNDDACTDPGNGNLDVYGDGTFGGTVTADTLTDGTASITGGAISGATTISASGAVTAGDLEVDSGTLSIDATNNRVGIGTTTPQAKLDVNGNIILSGGDRTISLEESSSSPYDLTISAGGTNDMKYGGDLFLKGGYGYDNPGGNVYIYGGRDTESANNNGNVILAYNGTSAVGNVGIGDSSPDAKLDVQGNIVAHYHSSITHPTDANGYVELDVYDNSGTKVGRILPYTGSSYIDLAIGDWNGGNPNIMLKTGGNVGIGNGAPDARLHVTGGVCIDNDTSCTDPGAGNLEVSGNITLGDDTAKDYYIKSASNNKYIELYDNNANGFNLASNSNINIFIDSDNFGSDAFNIDKGVFGTNLFTVKSNGNVGIGDSSPDAKLDVQGAALIGDTEGQQLSIASNGHLSDANEPVTIDDDLKVDSSTLYVDASNNRVGIGTTTPSERLDVNGNIILGDNSSANDAKIYAADYNSLTIKGSYDDISSGNNNILIIGGYTDDSGDGGNVYISGGLSTGGGDGNVILAHNGTSAVGYVGVGTDSPSYMLDVSGSGRFTSSVTASAFYYSSDKRLKKNIKPLKNALDKITKLQGVSFNWKDTNQTNKTQLGLIAQDVEKVYPELVDTDKKGYKSVQYGNLVAPLIEAIKEQQKEIDKLKKEIKKLKNE